VPVGVTSCRCAIRPVRDREKLLRANLAVADDEERC
jgi:hypothetical protein